MYVETWDNKLLKQKLKMYKAQLQKCKDDKRLIQKTIASYEAMLDTKSQKLPSYGEIIKKDQTYSKTVLKTIQIITKSNSIIAKRKLNLNNELQRVDIKRSKILNTTKTFYEGIGGIYYSKFLEYYQTKNIFINFLNKVYDEFGGGIEIIEGALTAFIHLIIYNALNDIATSIHEHGHAIGAAINYNHFKYSLLKETESIFFELVYLDSLNPDDFSEKDIIAAKKSGLYIYHNAIKAIDAKYRFLLGKKLSQKEAEKVIFQKFQNDYDLIDITLFSELKELIEYALSYLTAVELFVIYKKDSDASLSLLEKIINISSSKETNVLNKLKELNITPGENLDIFFNQFLNKKGTSKKLH